MSLWRRRGDSAGLNEISGGVFFGPVIMGQDVSVTLPREGPPSLVSLTAPRGRLEYRTRGRDTLVRTVSDLVLSKSGQVVVLHAAGGYGKTTVALRVVQNVEDQIDVWWVDASTETSLTEGLREVAIQAGGSHEDIRHAWSSGIGAAPDLLWRILDARSQPWLLVLDGADDLSLLAPIGGRQRDGHGWLRSPRSKQGTVLVTSRTCDSRIWGDAALYPVEALSDEAGAQMLLDQAPDAGSRSDALIVAQRLGGLPLALWLTGSYLVSTRSAPPIPGLSVATTFADYLEAWEKRFVDVTDLSWSTERYSDRELLTRTWELSLDLLAKRGFALSRPLLRTLSWFGPAPIPYGVLDADIFAKSHHFPELTPPRLRTLIEALAELGLVDKGTRDSNADNLKVPSVTLHPVIQDANRYHIQHDSQQDSYTELVVALLSGTVSRTDQSQRNWAVWRTLIPHVVVAREVATDERAQSEHRSESATICHEAGFFCEKAGLDHLCLEFNQSAVICRSALLGPVAPLALGSRHNLGKALRQLGRLDEAEAEYKYVLAAEEESRGHDHIETLTTRAHLASLFQERGHLDRVLRGF